MQAQGLSQAGFRDWFLNCPCCFASFVQDLKSQISTFSGTNLCQGQGFNLHGMEWDSGWHLRLPCSHQGHSTSDFFLIRKVSWGAEREKQIHYPLYLWGLLSSNGRNVWGDPSPHPVLPLRMTLWDDSKKGIVSEIRVYWCALMNCWTNSSQVTVVSA